jgi:hypothetical protein
MSIALMTAGPAAKLPGAKSRRGGNPPAGRVGSELT